MTRIPSSTAPITTKIMAQTPFLGADSTGGLVPNMERYNARGHERA